MNPTEVISLQQKFFLSNASKATDFRIAQLLKLKNLLNDNEELLFRAIYEDFGKSRYEAYLTELSATYQEINLAVKRLKSWSKRKRVSTNFANFPAKSYILPEPLGNTLIIGAWNYPYSVSLVPAISSLAAGNTVLLKPSEIADHTSTAMAKLINNNFPEEYFHVVEGGVDQTTLLLEQKFDKIFFTGSTRVGKIVYQAAARQLTPVTLEMGGKSPTFVLSGCNLDVTAKRIVWAKFLNAGQTCIAPDYVLVEKSIEQEFLEAVKKEISRYHDREDDIDDHYVRIINTDNFDRLSKFLENKVYCGGKTKRENRFIGPTVLDQVTFEDDIMKDEIFGPILPVIGFSDLDEVIAQVKARPKPLACYVYSGSRRASAKIIREISFGGGAINDSVMHMSNIKLPFGGVGFSGTGSYRGEAGFKTFSHYKSILEKPFWFESSLKYPPYTKGKIKLFKKILE